MSTLHGVMPILPTIFDDSGRIDRPGTRRVLEYVIAAGAAAVVFPGLASEYDTLTMDERLEMTEALGPWVAGRVPLVIGASAATEADAVRYAQAGAQAGAVAAMVLTPKSLAGDVSAMAGFYRGIHAASGIAIMVQNAPAPMGIGVPLAQIAAMAREVDGIRYVKEEAQPSGQRITELQRLAGGAIDAVFGGAGARYVIDEFVRGATGVMPACEITELHVQMHAHFVRGALAQARDLFERTLPLLNMQANFRWRLTKAVLQRRGLIDSAYVRAAGPSLDAFDVAELDDLLARLCEAGLLTLPGRA
jgi:2-keto-3-deoxy-L-arabinonate dehydratase